MKYSYAEIYEKRIVLTNERGRFGAWNDLVESPKVRWLSDNRIEILGKEIDVRFNYHGNSDIGIEDVEPRYVATRKFLWWSWKAIEEGWVVMKKRKPFRKVFTNYRVVEVM